MGLFGSVSWVERLHSAGRLTATFLLLPLTGCAGLQLSASSNYTQLVDQFPFRAERPLARTIRYSYVENHQLGDKDSPMYAADAQTKALRPGTLSLSLPSFTNSGPLLSDRYSEQARDYSSKGDHGAAQRYHGLSESQARAEMSMQRTEAAVGLALAAYAAVGEVGGAYVQAKVDQTALTLRDWVVTQNRAIGPEAPVGHVLQLDIRNLFAAEKWQLESRRDFLVTATLLDERGRAIRQGGSGWQLFLIERDGSKLALQDDLIALDKTSLPDEKKALMKPIKSFAHGYQLLLTVDAAIAELYEYERMRTLAR